ncbi:MAG: ComEA family DNA-binding protein [Pseudomonadota bacterium]
MITMMETGNRRRSWSAAGLISWGKLGLALGFAALIGAMPLLVAADPSQQQAQSERVLEVGKATVNINSADASTLAEQLKGVGQSRAEAIVRYRDTYGPFASTEELLEVKGIGTSTLELNRALITLD